MSVVVDSNIFARSAWIRGLLDASRSGQVQLFWSPCIILEVSRLLTWLYLKRQSGSFTHADWVQMSTRAATWFQFMTREFRVVEDRPPYPDQWVHPPPDKGDLPIWTAARNSKASFIVTEDMRSAPPPNPHGVRMYQGVFFMEAEPFLKFLNFHLGPATPSGPPDGGGATGSA